MVIGRLVVALGAGILFGAGLAVSGMTDPVRVRAFLDPAGAWDATLAFVMAGAMLPMALAWRIVRRRAAPLLDAQFHVPTARTVDVRLIAGSALFGIGWGIGGLCPGPAIASLALRPGPAAIFVGAMLVGFVAHRFLPAPTVRGR